MLMTKLSKIALLGSVALMAAVGCQREVVGEINHNNGEEAVKTQLILNVSTGSSTPTTKQDGKVTQEPTATGVAFRGINDAFLLPLTQSTNGKHLAKDQDASTVIDLSDVLNKGEYSSHKARVMEVQLPLTTNTLLFYAKAPKGDISQYDRTETGDYYGMNERDIFGHLDNYSIVKEEGSANFRLGIRMANTTEEPKLVEKFLDAEVLLQSIVNVIMNMDVKASHGTHEALSATAYGYAFNADPGVYNPDATGGFSYPEFKWSAYAGEGAMSPVHPSHVQYSLELKLRSLYQQMTTISTGELRASAGNEVLLIMQDLWTVVNAVRCATPASGPEAVAKYFAENISSELTYYFNTSSIPDDGGAVKITGYKKTADIISHLSGGGTWANGSIAKWWPAEDVDNSTSEPPYDAIRPTAEEMSALSALVGNDNKLLSEFPFNFNLPRGAAYMSYDKTHKVLYYPQTFDTSEMGTAGSYNATNYYYPPELLYFGNSPIRVNDIEKRGLSNYAAADEWVGSTKWTSDNWKWGAAGVVESSTRAVAMQNEINYGLAVLETKVKYGASTLEDNRHAVAKILNPSLPDDFEPNQHISVYDDTFTLTGIVIGGVSQNVGWDYLPYYEVNENGIADKKMVYGFLYDKAIEPSARIIPASGTSSPNYTLIFDNFKWTTQTGGIFDNTTPQDNVSVALEFRNNGDDFYGNYNLIKKGGYFYLIGTLKPAEATAASISGIKWGPAAADGGRNDGHVIPPYNADGTPMKIPRVFIQDHKTTATFSINAKSLQSAYLTVPDLRSTSISLGLDVDLNWEAGLTFEDVPLGQ